MPRRAVPDATVPVDPSYPNIGTFDPVRHEYRIDGIVVPSVTQVLNDERFIDFSHVPPGTLADAQERGIYVHSVLHAHLEDDFDLDDCAPDFRGYVDSALAYLADLGKRPLRDAHGRPCAVEFRFWHARRMFGGTIDYVGWDRDDVLSLDDWKTGLPEDAAAPLQTAAYECGLRDTVIPRINYTGPVRRRAVKLYADGRPAKPEPYTDPRDLSIFFNALSCVHYRRNHCQHPKVPYANG